MSLVSTVTYKKPMRGPAVQEIRRRLGLQSGFVYDDSVVLAVSDFQQAHNLPVTGEADPATIALMRAS